MCMSNPPTLCMLVFPLSLPFGRLLRRLDFNQVEYESDSNDSDNDVDIESEELVIGKPIMTRSRRQVKVWTRFDV